MLSNGREVGILIQGINFVIVKDYHFIVYKILIDFEKSKNQLKGIRDKYFDKFDSISLNEKARVVVLTNEVVKWRRKLDFCITKNLNNSLNKTNYRLLTILRIGYYELLFDEKAPNYAVVNYWVSFTKKIINNKVGGFSNAVLRKAEILIPNNKDTIENIGINFSYPKWIIIKWQNQFGKQNTIKLCKFFNLIPKFYIRLPISASHNDFFKKFFLKKSFKSNNFYKVKSGLNKIIHSNYFIKNNCSVQDRASGAVVELLNPKPGKIVLDVCAAPGTKTNYIADIMGESGKIFASDTDLKRIKIGKKRSESLCLNINWSQKNAEKDNFIIADYILIDAPCSGTGVMGKRVDIRWRRKKEDIILFCKTQINMLNNMSRFLNKGGTIVYSTCSLENEENWNVVSQFIKLNNNFRLDSPKGLIPSSWIDQNNCMQTLPYRDSVDGMFAARLIKQ